LRDGRVQRRPQHSRVHAGQGGRPEPEARRRKAVMSRTAAFVLAGLALAAAPAFAQQQYGELPMPERTLAAGAKAGILKDVGIDQRIGQQLPLDLTFKDES